MEIYSNKKDNTPIPVIQTKKGPVKLENGAIYEGEWLGEHRNGFGV